MGARKTQRERQKSLQLRGVAAGHSGGAVCGAVRRQRASGAPVPGGIGALLIQRRLKCSDVWLVKHIGENSYLHYFNKTWQIFLPTFRFGRNISLAVVRTWNLVSMTWTSWVVGCRRCIFGFTVSMIGILADTVQAPMDMGVILAKYILTSHAGIK